MSSVFSKEDRHTEKPKRNVYNKTFTKELSARFGELMPVFCQPVMNGESVKINHKHVFNFLPLVFPLQTRVRASLQYFYVRNRNVWKDWEDFQFKMKDGLIPPYHVITNENKHNLLRLGGFLDNLGCPVTLLEDIQRKVRVGALFGDPNYYAKWYNPYTNTFSDGKILIDFENSPFPTAADNVQSLLNFNALEFNSNATSSSYRRFRYPVVADRNGSISVATSLVNVPYYCLVRCVKVNTDATVTSGTQRSSLQEVIPTSRTSNPRVSSRRSGSNVSSRPNSTVGDIGLSSTTTDVSVTQIGVVDEYEYFIIRFMITETSQANNEIYLRAPEGYKLDTLYGYYVRLSYADSDDGGLYAFCNPTDYVGVGGLHMEDLDLADLPYANSKIDTPKHLRVLSLPARHFESIYNAFYRNSDNNPYKIDGVPEYNKYISETGAGADTFNYPRRFANWQEDAFTTALHTPQHGDAPLVGLVNQSTELPYRVTFANDDGTTNRVHFGYDQTNGSVKVYTNEEDGQSDGYVGQLKEAMIEAVKFGITINDFRNVNSFQRWLENNVRRGYKYRDQIKSHFGVSVRYDTLDMPEYLGGTSRDMDVAQVTQTVQSETGVLGDYAGQAWIKGNSKHSINHYCDEEGYIIGVLKIMPMASYSQVIPKHLLRNSALDYYSPEFGKIGMQPILNREIAPVASFYRDKGDEVFGYQRPWYDYLDCVDTLHGKFRTQFRNFVINRVFDGIPQLNENFLVYDPDHVNNVFYVDDDEDKILGSILFEYSSRIPIPLYGIPALE